MNDAIKLKLKMSINWVSNFIFKLCMEKLLALKGNELTITDASGRCSTVVRHMGPAGPGGVGWLHYAGRVMALPFMTLVT